MDFLPPWKPHPHRKRQMAEGRTPWSARRWRTAMRSTRRHSFSRREEKVWGDSPKVMGYTMGILYTISIHIYIYTYNNMYIYIYYIRNVWKLWKMEIWIVVSCFGNLGIEVIKNLSALMGHRLASISCAPSSRAIWVSSSPRRWALSGIRLVLWWREVALEYGEEWTFL